MSFKDKLFKHPESKLIAIDNIHSGDAKHAYYANEFMEKYNEDPWL